MAASRGQREAIAGARHLAELGYATTFRRSGWWECLLSSTGERWIGHGRTRLEALQHALGQALPSRAARELLRRAAEPAAEGHNGADGHPDHGAGGHASAASTVQPSQVERARVDGVAEAGDGRSGVPSAHAPLGAAPASAALPPRASELARIELPSQPRRLPRRPPEEIRARYDEIDAAIGETQGEAGLLEPERQRLLLLTWICHARANEVDSGGNRAAFERTRSIAQRCSRLARIWWPGAVRALGIDTSPRDCAGDLPAGPSAELGTWHDVAAAAEAAIEQLESEPGVDEHGWSDEGALAPTHAHPDALLLEIVAHLERLCGPVVRPGDPGDCRPEFAADLDAWRFDLQPWIAMARKLRWLRGSTGDLELWGAATGRMRWLAERLPRTRSDPLARVLDPRYHPLQSWARDLGHDPDKKRRQRERKALVSEPPEAGWPAERLRTWLARAFELGSDLPNDRIARLCEPVTALVLAFAPPGFSDKRNHRTRLETVQRILGRDPQEAETTVIASVEDDVAEESESFLDRLVAALAPHTRGRRALFVSNRNDPTIDELVRERFGFESVDHCEVKSANVGSKAESIARGTYDFVLAATGFLPHRVDGVLKAAARDAQVPYVSVYRGRPLSVARGLARELGLGLPAA